MLLDGHRSSWYITVTLNLTPMNDDSVTPPHGGQGDLRILAACPMCQTAYHPLKTRVVADRGDAHLLFLECRECGSAVVAIVTAGNSGLQSIGAITDLTRSELAQAASDATVSTDDVVDLVEWFEHNIFVQLTLRREKENF